VTPEPVRIVLIEDSEGDAVLVAEMLSDVPDDTFEIKHFTRLGTGCEYLTGHQPDCVLLDLSLPDASDDGVVAQLRRCAPDVPLVVLSGTRDPRLMVGALRSGAEDFLVKGSIDGEDLARSIRHARERARILTALRVQEEQSRRIIDSASDPFVSIDPAGAVVEWNRSAEELFGWRREEVLGRSLADTLVPPDLRGSHREGLRRLLAGGPARLLGKRVEVRAMHRSGAELPVELAIWSVGSGADLRFHAFMHDITERLQLQEERERANALAEREQYERRLQQAQRLESLGQLAGGVAHDFNNLLAVIGSYLDFVAEDVADAANSDPDKWKRPTEDLEQVRRTVDRATRLVSQLLAFGRRDVARLGVLDLNAVVTDVKQLLLRTIGEQIELVGLLHPDLWPITADPGQLEQILVNLAVNARDAMPAGGTLTISTGNLVLDRPAAEHAGVAPGRYVRLAVTDTGTGMSQEIADRIFEPFFTSKPPGSGTGLGLATVYGIVRRAEGQVQVESALGEGTTMTILLPATDREPTTAAAETAHAPMTGGGTETILLAEDEPALQEVTRRILTRHGYTVLVAGDAPGTVELARRHPGEIHLLLSDVVMPRLTGTEVARQVRELRPGIAVVYMSGYAHANLGERGILDAEVRLINKPFTGASLLHGIRRALDE
jgi:PAS domain S-box-containing protein